MTPTLRVLRALKVLKVLVHVATASWRGQRPRHRRGQGRGHERGSVSVQLVILMPALFSIMFLGMQAALYSHARSVAIASAAEGARTAGAQDRNLQQGLQAASSSFLADAGGDDVLKGAAVSGSRSATQATVTVQGRSLSVVPGWSISVTQSATVPVERITQPSGDFAKSAGSGGEN